MEDIKNTQGVKTTEGSVVTANVKPVQQPAEVQANAAETEITEQSVLELLDRVTALAERNGEAFANFELPDSGTAVNDAYYEAYKANRANLNASMEIQRQTIQALLETVKQMLEYLQNKNRKSAIDPETFLSFVQGTANVNSAPVDFAALWNQMSQHG